MNASTRESIAVGTTANGTVVFYNPDAPSGVRRLGPARDDLSDLTEQAQIPTLSAFVRELLDKDRDVPQAEDDTVGAQR